jgi:uncharacterized protein
MSKNVGKFVWYDVMTSDTKAAESFYRSVIGWDAKDSGKTDRSYTLFSAGPAMVGGLMPIPEEARAMGTRPTGGAPCGGMMTKTPQTPAPFWLYYFNVDALHAAITRVKDAGGQIIIDPMQVPGGSWIVHGLDPQGAIFAMVGPKR